MIEITTPIAVLTETFARLRAEYSPHNLDNNIQDNYVRPATIENGDEYCAGNVDDWGAFVDAAIRKAVGK